MWTLFFPLLLIAGVFFLLKKTGATRPYNARNKTKFGAIPPKNPYDQNNEDPNAEAHRTEEDPRQRAINRDIDTARKIFIYGGGVALLLLVAGIIYALNPSMGIYEKTQGLLGFALPVVIILGIIAIGSILPNTKKKSSVSKSSNNGAKADDFYKPYFCDEYGHIHYPTDHNFISELYRYSAHNARYYGVTFKEHEADWYIVDGYGNTVKIYNQSVINMRDSNGNYCRIKIK